MYKQHMIVISSFPGAGLDENKKMTTLAHKRHRIELLH